MYVSRIVTLSPVQLRDPIPQAKRVRVGGGVVCRVL